MLVMATTAILIGLGVLTLGLVLRWSATGHGPYLGKYEAFGSYAWALVVFYSLLQWRVPRVKPVGVVVAPAVFLLLGAGVLSTSTPQFESPAMHSAWLWIHVGMAKIALASLVLGAGTSVLYLRRERASRGQLLVVGESRAALEAGLPELEDLSVKLTSLGFLLLGVVIGAGALWANTAWGSYWSWDPIETWALATWVLYGGALHFYHLWHVWGTRWSRLSIGTLVVSLCLLLLTRVLTLSPHWVYMG